MSALCPTPKKFCQGSVSQTSKALAGEKVHGTHEQAFQCYANYLMNILGYKRIGSREFQGPDGIEVLTKKSRFGMRLRLGKGRRSMPRGIGGGVISG